VSYLFAWYRLPRIVVGRSRFGRKAVGFGNWYDWGPKRLSLYLDMHGGPHDSLAAQVGSRQGRVYG
jgi:hypothetical protein